MTDDHLTAPERLRRSRLAKGRCPACNEPIRITDELIICDNSRCNRVTPRI